jgi:GntR family phosphonate transport system transcriptional regulator
MAPGRVGEPGHISEHECDAEASRQSRPLWRQVQATMESEILSGQFQPGQRLPTEDELALRFRVHRHTVRRAVHRLREKGLLRVEQGRGTFVREPEIVYRVGRETRLTVAVQRDGRDAAWQFQSSATVRADQTVSKSLALPRNHLVRRVSMLRVVDGRVVAIHTSFYPLPRFDGIDAAIRDTGSITAAMRAFGINDFPRKQTSVRATVPSLRDAHALQIPRTKPVLELMHINVDSSGIPVQFGRSRHNAELMTLVFEF